MWFFAGRCAAHWSFVRRVMEDAGARAGHATSRKGYPTGFISAFRFLVGLRTISPIVIGTTHTSTQRPLVLNLRRRSLGPAFHGARLCLRARDSPDIRPTCRCIIIC